LGRRKNLEKRLQVCDRRRPVGCSLLLPCGALSFCLPRRNATQRMGDQMARAVVGQRLRSTTRMALICDEYVEFFAKSSDADSALAYDGN